MTTSRRESLKPSARWWLTGRALAIGFLLLVGHDPADAAQPAPPSARAAVDLRDRPMLGVATAPVVVVEISNFKCTHCRAFHQNVFPALRADYIDVGKVQWVVLNASDDAAEQFTPIFTIARCVQQQGKYWAMQDDLFRVAHRSPSFLNDLVARSPLVDREALETCVRDRITRNVVTADFGEYARLKIRGTPTFLLTKTHADGRRTETTVAGAQTLEHFRRVLDKLLKAP